jgi:hypothetical protein
MTAALNDPAYAWSTVAWICIVGSIFVGFAVSAFIAKRGRPVIAATVPLWLFAPTALASTMLDGIFSWTGVCIIAGLALAFAALTWGSLKGWDM